MLVLSSKEKMEASFLQYLEEIFTLPEIMSAAVKEITITRKTIHEAGRRAFEAGFHVYPCRYDCLKTVPSRLMST